MKSAKNLDCLLHLLDSTADALAAEWEMRSEGFRSPNRRQAIPGHER